MAETTERHIGVNFFDTLLLFIENLLAFRVVFSYLGAKGTLIHRLTDLFLFPLKPLIAATNFTSDSSVLELIPAVLVVLLFFIHRLLDGYLAEEVA